MSEGRDAILQSWAKFLKPEVLRGNLIIASIYLAAFETLRSLIIDRIRDFFTVGFGGDRWSVIDEYQQDVLSLDKSLLRASLLWLKEMTALDDADIAAVDCIREHRNELAHELPKYLTDAEAEINVRLLGEMSELVAKVDRWWIREVEIPSNPAFDGQDVPDEDITSGNALFIQMMVQIAMGEDSEVFWEEFQKQAGRALDQGDEAS